jgi:hypothetical protein
MEIKAPAGAPRATAERILLVADGLFYRRDLILAYQECRNRKFFAWIVDACAMSRHPGRSAEKEQFNEADFSGV